MTVADRPATYREVFAEPSFRALFVARTLAIGANAVQIFALSVLVYSRTASPPLSAPAFGARRASAARARVGGRFPAAIRRRAPARRAHRPAPPATAHRGRLRRRGGAR